MTKQENLKLIEQVAKKYFQHYNPCHGWDHVERVGKLAEYIGERESADLYIVKLSVLLHDIGREKEDENPNVYDHAILSRDWAEEILENHNINGEIAENVLHSILCHRFRKGNIPETIEARVLFDADKLDSIGAIGVARAYAWAGEKGLKLYSDKNYLGTGYEAEHSPLVEFKFKLAKVKDRLFTETAKQIALTRHKFMEEFFEELKREI